MSDIPEESPSLTVRQFVWIGTLHLSRLYREKLYRYERYVVIASSREQAEANIRRQHEARRSYRTITRVVIQPLTSDAVSIS